MLESILDEFVKIVTPVKTGAQGIYKHLKRLDSRGRPGPDPEFAGRTEQRNFTRTSSQLLKYSLPFSFPV
jgi:hypothetical protein